MARNITLRLFSILLAVFFLVGCSSGVFKIPKEEYRSQVKTLGVLPIIVDDQSAINHSQRDGVVSLLQRTSIGKLEASIEQLREKKGYFDVRYVGEDPRQLLQQLIVGPLPAVEKTDLPGGYRFSAAGVKQLAGKAVVDALLVVVLSGVEHEEKRSSRNKLENLTTKFNDIMATATVVDRQGRVLWEMNGEDAYKLLALQYPDFDEAYFNRSDAVALKEVRVEGLERVLTVERKKDQPPRMAPVYRDLVDKVVDALSPSLLTSF